MKASILFISMLFFAVIAGAVTAQITSTEVPVEIDQVKLDDTELSEFSDNQLSVERGSEYEVRVQLSPDEDVKNVQVRAEIDGYEFSDVQSIDDKTQLFDAKANVTYVKKLNIKIPDDVERDSYKLRIIVSDRFHSTLTQEYDLQIDAPRNALDVRDVIFNPSDAVRSGSSLLTTVRVENKGERTQDDVKVTVSIPGLGVTGSQFINKIKNDDNEEQTEEIFLRVPKCAKAGTYDVNVEVEFMKGHRKVSEKRSMTVLGDDTCDQATGPQTTITLGSQMQSVVAGQTAVYPITITNAGKTSRTFTVSVPSNDWSSVSITPTSTLVVPAGQTQTVFVNVNVNEDVKDGAHALVALVSSKDASQELTLTASVTAQGTSASTVLTVVLIVLVVLLIILGVVVGIANWKSREQTEAYY